MNSCGVPRPCANSFFGMLGTFCEPIAEKERSQPSWGTRVGVVLTICYGMLRYRSGDLRFGGVSEN